MEYRKNYIALMSIGAIDALDLKKCIAWWICSVWARFPAQKIKSELHPGLFWMNKKFPLNIFATSIWESFLMTALSFDLKMNYAVWEDKNIYLVQDKKD